MTRKTVVTGETVVMIYNKAEVRLLSLLFYSVEKFFRPFGMCINMVCFCVCTILFCINVVALIVNKF